MSQEVFKRYEKKYMLTKEQYNALLGAMITQICPDSYGKHTICNLYFDTPDYLLIRRSLEKPTYKEKIRLRSYGAAKKDGTVFLELKKKYKGVVYKRRVQMKLEEAEDYLYHGIRPKTEGQIFREIDYAYRLYQARPAVYLAYDRIAFYGKEDPNLRVTFDMNIRARRSELYLSASTYGTPLLDEDRILMEVKIPGVMPVWMSRLFSEMKIFPVSFSKYGTYYKDYIWMEQKKEQIGGVICA